MLYADHAATTPCRDEVVALMQRVLAEDFGNPSSTGYPLGRRARGHLDQARTRIAAAIGARDEEIVFTAGATESCNLALIGCMQRLLATRPRMLVAATEHPAVRAAAEAVAAAGGELEVIPVDAAGRLDLTHLAATCDHRTALVAAMLVNNETSVIHDLPAVAEIAHRHGALVLCDATQALGKLPCATAALGCDLLAATGHKIYGPKGAGFLWIRRGLALAPLIHGGGQERGLRSGTENVPAIAGLGHAVDLAANETPALAEHLAAVTARLEDGLRAALPGLCIHGAETARAPGISMLTLPGTARGWRGRVRGVCISGGSSCASGTRRGSAALLAMGVDEEEAGNALRVSLGRDTTTDAVDAIAAAVIAAAR